MIDQLALTFETPVVAFARARALSFRDDFPDWLEQNLHVWRRFVEEADKAYARGRRHYSARTIVEYLRHETALREIGGEWKINNNTVPDMARLYMLLRPERDGLFELRRNEAREAA